MAKVTSRKRLGDLLVEASVITAEQLDFALTEKAKKKNSGIF